MSIISRITNWTAGQVLKAADLNNEFNNITTLLNNLNSGATSWSNVLLAGNQTTALGAAAYSQLQCVQIVSQNFNSTGATTSSTSFTNTTFTATITPTSASNKIRITMCGTLGIQGTVLNALGVATIYRGVAGTNLGDATMGLSYVNNVVSSGSASNGSLVPCTMVVVDSPATTSAVTYALYFRSTNGGDSVVWTPLGGQSWMILEEVLS